ncbi:MAG: hypothetical protein ACPGQH_09275, partial [Candidatus Puniceispirillaceae bacterium]
PVPFPELTLSKFLNFADIHENENDSKSEISPCHQHPYECAYFWQTQTYAFYIALLCKKKLI